MDGFWEKATLSFGSLAFVNIPFFVGCESCVGITWFSCGVTKSGGFQGDSVFKILHHQSWLWLHEICVLQKEICVQRLWNYLNHVLCMLIFVLLSHNVMSAFTTIVRIKNWQVRPSPIMQQLRNCCIKSGRRLNKFSFLALWRAHR